MPYPLLSVYQVLMHLQNLSINIYALELLHYLLYYCTET